MLASAQLLRNQKAQVAADHPTGIKGPPNCMQQAGLVCSRVHSTRCNLLPLATANRDALQINLRKVHCLCYQSDTFTKLPDELRHGHFTDREAKKKIQNSWPERSHERRWFFSFYLNELGVGKKLLFMKHGAQQPSQQLLRYALYIERSKQVVPPMPSFAGTAPCTSRSSPCPTPLLPIHTLEGRVLYTHPRGRNDCPFLVRKVLDS